MALPRKPNDGVSGGGGGTSRAGTGVTTVGPFSDTAWHAIDGAADISPGEYELTIRGAAATDVYELTWAASISAAEQVTLGATATGRAVWVNSPICITVTAGLARLAVRAISTPSGAGWSAVLSPII